MENNMFEDIVAEGNIVVINNNWIVLCKRWKPWCHNLFCYLYLHKENKNLMVGSHFTMTEDKKKSTRLATNEERLMLFEEMFKYGIAFDKHVHHLVGKLVGVTDCDTENVPYVNAASLWHDLKEDKPPLRKWVMFRYSGGGVNPTALHYGAMSDDIWVVTRGDGTQRIEVLYECYDKIEWLDFDELK